MGDSGRFSGGGQKMSFSQTCNLLSQYVKEKRARGVDGYNRPTMNLFPVSGKSSEDSNGCVGRTINLFPQLSGFNPSVPMENPTLMGNSCVGKRASPEPPAAQMTIFYGGKVMVFDDLPADKAKEVMDLASNIESSLKKRKLEGTNLAPTSPMPRQIPNPSPNPSPILNSNPSQGMNISPGFGINNLIPTASSQSPVTKVNDLPIARKASLHRFLEKRKDRLVGKAPLSSDAAVATGSSKPMEPNSWLGLNSLPVFQAQQKI